MSVERWVDVCCAAPARAFGLAPRKGVLAVGSDADVVIFDPEREGVISWQGGDSGALRLHENCDYTPYEGFRVRGWPALTMFRGRVIVRDGQYVGGAGGGQFLAGQPFRE